MSERVTANVTTNRFPAAGRSGTVLGFAISGSTTMGVGVSETLTSPICALVDASPSLQVTVTARLFAPVRQTSGIQDKVCDATLVSRLCRQLDSVCLERDRLGPRCSHGPGRRPGKRDSGLDRGTDDRPEVAEPHRVRSPAPRHRPGRHPPALSERASDRRQRS